MKFQATIKFPLRKTLVCAAIFAIVLYVGWTYFAIASQAEQDEARRADVIVVFGAAEYSGKPSPVYRARLEHAYYLYRRGLAPFVITSGGPGDSKFSEGAVGRDFLVAQGIPETNVIAETTATDTADSAERVANIMRSNGMRSCLAVSDGYHLYRIKKMLAKQGIEAFGSPRLNTKQQSGLEKAGTYLREVVSFTLWKIGLT